MSGSTKNINIRWFYLVLGVVALLFAGILYGWSILKTPLDEIFSVDLTLNFTLTMCFFCLGGTVGGLLSKRIGSMITLIIAGILAFGGFSLASRLDGSSVVMLYLTYGVLAGLGIGIAYNVIISTVNAWFPDKKGLCSGALMMGFGASTLVIGSLAQVLMDSIGWQTTYLVLGVSLGIVMVVVGLILRAPGSGVKLPQPAPAAAGGPSEDFEVVDRTPAEMLRRPTFWRAFICIIFLAAVGNTVISFAKQLSMDVGAAEGLATTLVGVLSVCNGLGRIATGALYDKLGRRKTMLLANIVAIAAAGVTLISVLVRSLPLCVLGLCFTGVSYGSCPTISSAFVSSFYGTKNFPINFSVMNFNLMGASFIATGASMVRAATGGGFIAPFVLLLALAAVALVLNVSIKRP